MIGKEICCTNLDFSSYVWKVGNGHCSLLQRSKSEDRGPPLFMLIGGITVQKENSSFKKNRLFDNLSASSLAPTPGK